MTEFIYNHIKSGSIKYTLFKFNYGYYIYNSWKDNINPRFKSRLAN